MTVNIYSIRFTLSITYSKYNSNNLNGLSREKKYVVASIKQLNNLILFLCSFKSQKNVLSHILEYELR